MQWTNGKRVARVLIAAACTVTTLMCGAAEFASHDAMSLVLFVALNGNGADVSQAERLVSALRGEDAKTEAAAIRRLRREPEMAARELSSLLALAQGLTGDLSPDALRIFRGKPRSGYSDLDYNALSKRSSVLMMCVADAIRETADETKRQKAMDQFLPVVRSAWAGEIGCIPPKDALTVFFYSVFFPGEIVIAPKESAERKEVLSLLSDALKSSNADIRKRAEDLRITATCALPDHAVDLHSKKEYAYKRLEFMFGPFPESAYRNAQAKSDEQLLKIIQTGDPMGRGGLAYVESCVISKRLVASANRERLMLGLLAVRELRQRFSYLVAPPFTDEDAAGEDKQLANAMMDFCEEKLLTATGTKYNSWVIACLARLIMPGMTVDEMRIHIKILGTPPARPYALDRVLALFARAVHSNDARTREGAIRMLGNAAWLDRSAAEFVIGALGPNRPGAPGPMRNAWDIASEALQTFERYQQAIENQGNETPGG